MNRTHGVKTFDWCFDDCQASLHTSFQLFILLCRQVKPGKRAVSERKLLEEKLCRSDEDKGCQRDSRTVFRLPQLTIPQTPPPPLNRNHLWISTHVKRRAWPCEEYVRSIYSRGAKHMPCGLELARQRVQSGALDDFAKCENCGEVINPNFSLKCSAIPDLSTGGPAVLIRATLL